MGRNVGVQVLRGIKANIPTLLAGEVYFCTDTHQVFIGSSGGNVLENLPVYNTSGVSQIQHIVTGSVTTTSKTVAQVVTLTGNAVFTSATSYTTLVFSATAGHITITQTSGTSLSFLTGAIGDVINFVCIGS